MQGKFIEKLVALMLVAFMLFYAGYQASRFLVGTVKTDIVYDYTVSRTISAKALIFRDETVLEETGAGIQSCLFDDGERVLVGQPVVEYLNSLEGGGNRSRLREAQWEISMLQDAQNTSLSHFSNAEALGRDIKQQMNLIVQMSASGRFEQAREVRPSIVSLINKRQIATGKEMSFQTRIDSLTREREELRSSSGRDVNSVVKTAISGYYAKPVDGLESFLDISTARTAGFDEMLELLNDPPSPRTQPGAGRIVTSQNWYVAVKVEKFDVQWIQPGLTLSVAFDNNAGQIPATVDRVLSVSESAEAILILHCNHMSADTINLRYSDARLIFGRYTGLRVDAANLRFQDGERGVYTLDNNVVRFKKLAPIYEEPGFLLSAQPVDPYDTSTLRQYDQIIVKGTELADGKVIE